MRLILPIFVLVIVAAALSYLPIRRELAYRLHLSFDSTTSCCQVDDILGSTGAYEYNSQFAYFNNQPVAIPENELAKAPLKTSPAKVLGSTINDKGEEKWMEVSLQNQELVAWEGHTIIQKFPISSGRWFPTPKGTFYIWYKTRNQRMEGGSKFLGTYYNLPNVPNNMFFYEGYAVHGAYWHNNFGHPMSHGCVNSPLAEAAKLFAWAGPVVPEGANVVKASEDNPGTRVWVH